MRGEESDGVHPIDPRDRELWRRSQAVEIEPTEAERFLDLAAFADGRLDEDEAARVAVLLAADPAAAADVAAARKALAATTPVDALTIARAVALVDDADTGDAAPRGGEVIAFPLPRHVAARPWFSAAGWSGLAAAIALASWVGFDLGRGFYEFGTLRAVEGISASELIDPAPRLMRDFTENSQI